MNDVHLQNNEMLRSVLKNQQAVLNKLHDGSSVSKKDVTELVQQSQLVATTLEVSTSINDIDSTMFDFSQNESSFVTDKKSPAGKYKSYQENFQSNTTRERANQAIEDYERFAK